MQNDRKSMHIYGLEVEYSLLYKSSRLLLVKRETELENKDYPCRRESEREKASSTIDPETRKRLDEKKEGRKSGPKKRRSVLCQA